MSTATKSACCELVLKLNEAFNLENTCKLCKNVVRDAQLITLEITD